MRLLFVRHGESLGNIGGEYDASMHGNLSPKGYQQAEDLVDKLDGFAFDRILVSPLERAVLTILPYLKKRNLTAEVWQELVEMRGRKDVSTPLPPEFRFGSVVNIPDAAERHVFVPGGMRLPPPDESYEEGQRRTRQACLKIMDMYDGKDVTIMVVGHACSGARMLEGFFKINMDGRFQHTNTGRTWISQKANGEFISHYINRV
jgi:broad specificity phosphatase PhoE